MTRRNRPLLLLTLALAGAGVARADVYAVSGEDPRLGRFTGSIDVTSYKEGWFKTRYAVVQTLRFADGTTEVLRGRDGTKEGDKVEVRVVPTAGATSVLAVALDGATAPAALEGTLVFEVDDAKQRWSSALTLGERRLTATGARPGLTRGATGYRFFQGVPFVKGSDDPRDIHESDPRQGYLGNCYMIASFIALAQTRPERLRAVIVDQGDGVWEVTIDGQGYRLEQAFPTKDSDTPLFSKLADQEEVRVGDDDVTRYETWPMMLERAFAQRAGNYAGIENGWPRDVFSKITGPATLSYDATSSDLAAFTKGLREGVAAGRPVCISFVRGVGDFGGDLHDDHSYVVVREEGGKFRLYNPWGSSHPSRAFSPEELFGLKAIVDVGE